MTPEQFTYWLQGYMEILDPKTIEERETQIIKDHLDLVFKKVTPDRDKSDTNFTGLSSHWVCGSGENSSHDDVRFC